MVKVGDIVHWKMGESTGTAKVIRVVNARSIMALVITQSNHHGLFYSGVRLFDQNEWYPATDETKAITELETANKEIDRLRGVITWAIDAIDHGSKKSELRKTLNKYLFPEVPTYRNRDIPKTYIKPKFPGNVDKSLLDDKIVLSNDPNTSNMYKTRIDNDWLLITDDMCQECDDNNKRVNYLPIEALYQDGSTALVLWKDSDEACDGEGSIYPIWYGFQKVISEARIYYDQFVLSTENIPNPPKPIAWKKIEPSDYDRFKHQWD